MKNRVYVLLSTIFLIVVMGILLLAYSKHINSTHNSSHTFSNIINKKMQKNGIKKPSSWFYAQRAYPSGFIPPLAVKRARRQAQTLRHLYKDNSTWQQEGPFNIGGRVTAICVNPLNNNIFYIGTADGGVFKTADRGATFQQIFTGQTSISIGALAIDPNDTSTIYIGTGESNASGDSFDGDGIYISHNSGASFTNSGLNECGRISSIVVDPESSNIVFAGCMGYLFAPNAQRGVFKTNDRGATWSKVLYVDDTTGCIDLAINPIGCDTIYAAMWHRIRSPKERTVWGATSGIYRSEDNGTTWTKLQNGLPQGDTIGRIGIAIAHSNPSVLYAIYADNPGYFMGLYKSLNSGDTWSRTNDADLGGLYNSYGWYFGKIYVSPQDENSVYALGLDIYHSGNGGNSWNLFTDYTVHVDHHAMYLDAANPDLILDGNDGGLYITEDMGNTWSHFDNLPITQFYNIGLDRLHPERLYGGSQDNGTVRTFYGNTSDWENIYGGDGFHVIVDPTNSNIIYAEYQWGGLGKSTDCGSSWADATNGIDYSDRTNWNTPYVMDPKNHNVLYLGTYRVYKTIDAATAWNAISPDLTNGGSKLVFGTITALHVNPVYNNFIYAGTDDGNVWYSPDTGRNWVKVSQDLPNRYVTSIHSKRDEPAVFFVTLSGYDMNEHVPYIYMTEDTGHTWTDITYNLPEAPCNALCLDPNYDIIYVGTDVGVFEKTFQDTIWTPLGQGLPISVVMDMAIDSANRTLYVGTHGLSMYSITLPTSSVQDIHIKNNSPVSIKGNIIRNTLQIDFANGFQEYANIAIYSLDGRKLKNIFKGHTESKHLTVNVQSLPGGMYFLSVRTKSLQRTFKIYKQ